MSTFNLVVPAHPLAPLLLRAINWAQPDDPENKYPVLGRMRYVWMDKDKNIKLMLRDAPDSWSEQKSEVESQIKGHETFIGMEISTKDSTHIVATFSPVMETSYDRSIPMDEFLDNIDLFDESAQSKGWPSIYKDPWELFDEALERMKNGELTPEVAKFGEQLKDALVQSDVDDQLKSMTDEAGIDGLEVQKVKVLSVDKKGNLNDETERFMKGQENGKTPGQDTE